MNKTNIFQDLQLQAFRKGIVPRTKGAQDWFRSQLSKMRTINRYQLLKNETLSEVSRPKPGDMYMYSYEAKGEGTTQLPYYDRFPLIILVDKAPGGFYGLNLHYLPIPLRAKFFDTLMETMTDKKYTDSTRLSVSYALLKQVSKMKYFKACYKRYLTTHVQSQIVKVEPTEWDIALFLPTQNWYGSTAKKVYSDSRSKI